MTVKVRWAIAALSAALVIMAIIAAVVLARQADTEVASFQSCKDAGGAILESYPERCMIAGKSFTNPEQSLETGDSASDYVGLSEQDALNKAAAEGKTARVVERDGEALPVTMDFMPGRLNLYVKEGVVYMVQIEGESE